MKYFLPEYLDAPNNELWDKACREYNDYMTENEAIFSKAFLKEYHSGGFHDYRINQIKTEFTDSGAVNITVELEHNGSKYLLISKDVTSSSVTINNQDKSILNNCYLYGEYYKDADGAFNHNFLFGNGSERDITSKGFVFETQKESIQQ